MTRLTARDKTGTFTPKNRAQSTPLCAPRMSEEHCHGMLNYDQNIPLNTHNHANYLRWQSGRECLCKGIFERASEGTFAHNYTKMPVLCKIIMLEHIRGVQQRVSIMRPKVC